MKKEPRQTGSLEVYLPATAPSAGFESPVASNRNVTNPSAAAPKLKATRSGGVSPNAGGFPERNDSTTALATLVSGTGHGRSHAREN
ncbi:MAG: hypothetical protein ACK6D7_17570, partial [Acidobacteriota bacterium]